MAADEFVNAIETLPTTLLDRQQSMKALTSKLIGRAPSAASALHAGEPPSVGSAREAALGTPAEAAAAASAEPPCAAEAAETTEAAETAEAAEAAEAPLLVELELGDMLVWRGDLVHAGAGYDVEHVRVHAYIDTPDHIYRRPRGRTNLCGAEE